MRNDAYVTRAYVMARLRKRVLLRKRALCVTHITRAMTLTEGQAG